MLMFNYTRLLTRGDGVHNPSPVMSNKRRLLFCLGLSVAAALFAAMVNTLNPSSIRTNSAFLNIFLSALWLFTIAGLLSWSVERVLRKFGGRRMGVYGFWVVAVAIGELYGVGVLVDSPAGVHDWLFRLPYWIYVAALFVICVKGVGDRSQTVHCSGEKPAEM